VDFLHIVALAVVQSVTEFLPVGSEAHVELVRRALPFAERAEALTIPIHLGTVLAVLVYFHSELLAAIVGTYHLAIGRSSDNARLTVKLFIGSVPLIAVGAALLLLGLAPDGESSLLLLGWTMVGFGALLFLADPWA
jgi:undecaprenyl-diphosphatase